MISKVLVANRGEIALRVIRTLRRMGITSVAVYSEADRASPHVLFADEAYFIGPPSPRESYLNIGAVIGAAKGSGAQAVHPGYGFLSENPDFAQACRDAGLTFIGPPPEAIRTAGDKLSSRKAAERAGVPLVPGSGELSDYRQAREEARRLGFPVMLKASRGGGGKGMRVVACEEEMQSAYGLATGEARAAFGNPSVYLERLYERPRHVEVQVLADEERTIALFERECSVQRRHQKVIEESPSPAVDDDLRKRMCEAAVKYARALDYRSAGTVEMILSPEGEFFFLEMNTRLQVEHPVTEMTTGLDLVQEQVRIAAGGGISEMALASVQSGHAVEARVYAEDPAAGFAPSPGEIVSLYEPSGPFVRVDSGVRSGQEVTVWYDPLLAKVTAWGHTRDIAISRLKGALYEYRPFGLVTNVPLLLSVLEHPDFQSGEYNTSLLEGISPAPPDEAALGMAAAAYKPAPAAKSGGRPRSGWRSDAGKYWEL